MNDSAENFLAAHDDPRSPTIYREGDRIAGWRITAFLGRGGSGEVYRVERDRPADVSALSSHAAIKVLYKDTDIARMRFRRETELLAKMNNPAFPRFIAKGEVDGRPYLVTELLEPRNLPAADSDVADFLLKLCDGISVLHRMGYVHRDIKPGNILWRGTAPVLIDLGLVKDVARNFKAEGTSISQIDGHVLGVGTPGYAAPEQLTGDAISPAADIHALGMLARKCFNVNAPSAWERIIRRAVSSVPAYRYPDIASFAHAIRLRHWRDSFMCAVFLAAACGIVFALLFSRTQSAPSLSPPASTAGSIVSRRSADVAEQKRGLVREINEMLQKSKGDGLKASQKMDDIYDATERLSATTNKDEKDAIFAHTRQLQSELNEYVRLRIAATNGIDVLTNKLKAMSDSEPTLQVTR